MRNLPLITMQWLGKNKVKDSSFPAALVSIRTDDFELTCFSKATKHHQWRAAVTKEISALFRNDAWTLVPHCPQMNIVGWKWVFHISTKLMVLLTTTKQDLLQKVSINKEASITLWYSTQHHSHSFAIVVSNNWVTCQLDVAMLSYIRHYLRTFTCLSLRDS